MDAKDGAETKRGPEEKEKKKKDGLSVKEKKRARKRRNDAKMKNYAATIGVEDNGNYRRFKPKERLTINLSNTKYYIVKFVAKSLFNFKCSWKNQEPEQMDAGDWGENKQTEDWDIFWTDNGVLPERISKMKPYQKVNHFPGMFQLARKNHLARNLTKLQKEFGAQYRFFPKTFLLPSEYGEFKSTLSCKNPANRPVYIVKPESGCQGRGIFLTNTVEDLSPEDHYVVQQYIRKPMLIDELKFDARLYVLLLSVDPLRIYLFKEGMARFSTEPYKVPNKKNMSNMYMHLTNYAINCRNKGKFVFNKGLDEADTGHKRTFTSVLEHIAEEYDDGEQKCDELMHKIE
jgi:tubulin polyglutamylase TTLL6/13